VLQQAVGINSIFYYGSVLWQAVGFMSADSLWINVVTGAVNIVSTLVAIALIDHVGRKPLLLWGSIGMSVTLAAVVFVFATGASGASGASGQLLLPPGQGQIALIAANLYVFAFGLSWGPCVWVLLGEMFSNRIRGAALAVAAFAQWMANWIVTVSFPPVLDSLGPGAAYAVYLFFALASIIFIVRKVQETRGRSLEQM
jgi:SP family sugar:H+ symporter-like MFS transporter